MQKAYIYEYAVKWYGLKIKAIKIDASNNLIMWSGPWRWSRKKAFNDTMEHSFVAFSSLFNEDGKPNKI